MLEQYVNIHSGQNSDWDAFRLAPARSILVERPLLPVQVWGGVPVKVSISLRSRLACEFHLLSGVKTLRPHRLATEESNSRTKASEPIQVLGLDSPPHTWRSSRARGLCRLPLRLGQPGGRYEHTILVLRHRVKVDTPTCKKNTRWVFPTSLGPLASLQEAAPDEGGLCLGRAWAVGGERYRAHASATDTPSSPKTRTCRHRQPLLHDSHPEAGFQAL